MTAIFYIRVLVKIFVLQTTGLYKLPLNLYCVQKEMALLSVYQNCITVALTSSFPCDRGFHIQNAVNCIRRSVFPGKFFWKHFSVWKEGCSYVYINLAVCLNTAHIVLPP